MPQAPTRAEAVLVESDVVALGRNTGLRVRVVERDGKPWVLLVKVATATADGPTRDKGSLAAPAMPGSLAPFFDDAIADLPTIRVRPPPTKASGRNPGSRVSWHTVYGGYPIKVRPNLALQVIVESNGAALRTGFRLCYRKSGEPCWTPTAHRIAFALEPAGLAAALVGLPGLLRGLDAYVPADVADALLPPWERAGRGGVPQAPAQWNPNTAPMSGTGRRARGDASRVPPSAAEKEDASP